MLSKLEPWTIKQLYQCMLNDLLLCNTDFERTMCKIICKKEMIEFSKKLNRKLTPREQAIIDNL